MIKELLNRWRKKKEVPAPATKEVVSRAPAQRISTPDIEWKEFVIPLEKGCPDCGCEEFLEGPSGGACTNVMCNNCHSKFNLCWPLKLAHRIG